MFSGSLNLHVCIWMVTRGCLCTHWRCEQSGLVLWIAPSESHLPSVTYWATPPLPVKLQQCEQSSCCVPSLNSVSTKLVHGPKPLAVNVPPGYSTSYALLPANPTHVKSISSFSPTCAWPCWSNAPGETERRRNVSPLSTPAQAVPFINSQEVLEEGRAGG